MKLGVAAIVLGSACGVPSGSTTVVDDSAGGTGPDAGSSSVTAGETGPTDMSGSGGTTDTNSDDGTGTTTAATMTSDATGATTGENPADPFVDFNIIFRQTQQACGGCGIWFDWQGVDEDKPHLEVTWATRADASVTTLFGEDLEQADGVSGFYIEPGDPPGDETHRHSILVKDSPVRTGLFRTSITAIPLNAEILYASLEFHIHTEEGLANSDNSSILEVWSCPTDWDPNEVSWTHARSDLEWLEPGGDFGTLIREIRAGQDMHDAGFSKANPDASFDITEHVRALQEARRDAL
jgi:hypothetical protein